MDRGMIAALILALVCAPSQAQTPPAAAAPASPQAQTPPPAAAAAPPSCPDSDAAGRRAGEWRRMASDADRARLRAWRESWTAALGPTGGATDTGDAALFAPDRALADALPPYGTYRCRLHQLGKGARAVPGWVGCRVEEDKGLARLVVEGGTQRPVGHLYPDTEARGVFLGTVMIGDETRPLRYGRDRLRDLAGFVERVDERRWRIALPRPSFGGEMDLIELVPA